MNHRINRFCSSCASMNLNPCDGIEWKNNYIVFPNGEVLNLHGKKMIGMVDRCGYREVIINGKNERVHRIIATIFVPNPNNYDTVNHKDGNKLNNKVENLEWCTRSQNVLHAYRMRLERRITGEKHHSHKLTNKDVRYIKSHYKYRDRVYGAAALGRKYNVHYSTILSVVRGETWREVV